MMRFSGVDLLEYAVRAVFDRVLARGPHGGIGELALLAGVFVLSTTAMLQAEGMRSWSYQQLLDESDLVVIAVPTASGDTKERNEDLIVVVDESEPRAIGKVKGIPTLGIETRFRVSSVLKGDKTLKEFVLHHYRLEKPQLFINPSALVTFDPARKGAFLLYLRREIDGRYAPTSGQRHPGLFAVHGLGGFVN